MTSPNSNNSSINKDEICAKIEALGGMVIDKYDGDIVSRYLQIIEVLRKRHQVLSSEKSNDAINS